MTPFLLMGLGLGMICLAVILNTTFAGYVEPKKLVAFEGDQWIPGLILVYAGGLIALLGGLVLFGAEIAILLSAIARGNP